MPTSGIYTTSLTQSLVLDNTSGSDPLHFGVGLNIKCSTAAVLSGVTAWLRWNDGVFQHDVPMIVPLTLLGNEADLNRTITVGVGETLTIETTLSNLGLGSPQYQLLLYLYNIFMI